MCIRDRLKRRRIIQAFSSHFWSSLALVICVGASTEELRFSYMFCRSYCARQQNIDKIQNMLRCCALFFYFIDVLCLVEQSKTLRKHRWNKKKNKKKALDILRLWIALIGSGESAAPFRAGGFGFFGFSLCFCTHSANFLDFTNVTTWREKHREHPTNPKPPVVFSMFYFVQPNIKHL